jgi:two-component system, LytTR family, sensor histidine kinase AlgZ
MEDNLTAPLSAPRTDDTLFLPDFCNIRIVFAAVMIAQLLAFILVLGPQGNLVDRWINLSLTSLFIQWVALSSIGILCLCRPVMRRWENYIAGIISYLLVLVVTVVLSEIAYLISKDSGIETLLTTTWHTEFVLRNLAISAIISAVALRYFYVQHQLKNNIEAEARARIQALQARIHPHFLFNSMNTIASLTRSQPALAEEVVEDLADLFRVSLSDSDKPVPITKELELSRHYLNIEKLRLGQRLTVQWQLDALPDDAMIPPLMIQPLLENAIYHGIEPLTENGVIHISGHQAGSNIEFVITNPVPQHLPKSRRTSNHIAIANIRERLQIHYNKQGKLETRLSDNRFNARLVFPYTRSQR